MTNTPPLRSVQRVVAEVLIPRARECQTNLIPQDDALAIALELGYTAFAIKKAHQDGALFIVKRFCARCGLDADEVLAFVATTIRSELESGGE